LRLKYREGSLPKPHPSLQPQGFEIGGGHGVSPETDPSEAFQLNPTEHPGAEWLGKDHQGGVVFTRAGVLYRLARKQEIVLRDFNPDQPPLSGFNQIAPAGKPVA
jgi:hypothetical protein